MDVVADVACRLAPAEQVGEGVGDMFVDVAVGLAEIEVVGEGGGVGRVRRTGPCG